MMVVKLPRHSPRLQRKLSHLLALADQKQWGEGRQGVAGVGRAWGERAGSWGRLYRKPSQLLHGSAVRHDLQIGRSVGLFQATRDRLGYGAQQVLVPRVQANQARQWSEPPELLRDSQSVQTWAKWINGVTPIPAGPWERTPDRCDRGWHRCSHSRSPGAVIWIAGQGNSPCRLGPGPVNHGAGPVVGYPRSRSRVGFPLASMVQQPAAP